MSSIIKKVNWNKKNKQPSVTLPSKKLKKMDPTIKFGENLFVEIKISKKKRK